MATYTVQRGDSPASIASKLAGCPKCAVDLVAANPAKKRVRYPNGYVTFASLDVGERLHLPHKWSDGTLDKMPADYFSGLASPDGRLGALPLIPHCHAFAAQAMIDQSLASDTPNETMSKALGANGFTNYFSSPPDQNGNIVVSGVWEGTTSLDPSQSFSDGQGSRVHFTSVTDNGAAQGLKKGPCASVILNPKIIQNLGPPQKQYNQPQGHVQPPQGLKNPSGCPANYARDTVTNQCTPVCPDGTATANGACVPSGMSTGMKWTIGIGAAAAAVAAVVLINR